MRAEGALCPRCKERRSVALIKEDAPNGKCHQRGEDCIHITGAKCLTCGREFGVESPFDFQRMTGV